VRLYFSGFFTSPDLVNKLQGDYGVLLSYLEVRGKRPIPALGKPIFLDSGAFSVMTGKTKVDLESYCSFVNENKDKVVTYANLDVIGNAEETDRNQLYMESIGLNPLPTFHNGSDYKYLYKLIEKYDYIGLGGLVPIARKKDILFKHLDKCFSIIAKEKPEIMTHGWGMTGRDVVFRYPFYSIDSTLWLIGGRFIQRNEYSFRGMRRKKDNFAVAMKYHDINIANAKQIYHMICDATSLWTKRGVTWKELPNNYAEASTGTLQ